MSKSKPKVIDTDTVKKISNLIKIKLQDSELPKYEQQLNTVLDSVDVLTELDTENVGETSQTHGLKNVLRNDEDVTPALDMSKYQNQRNFKNGYFIVNKVI